MTPLSRRRLLGATAATATAGVLTANAEAAQAAGRPQDHSGQDGPEGGLDTVKHVVVLMQENRSFDHYLGTLGGVRGFDDKRGLRLPGGKSVFHQPAVFRTDGQELLPFRMDSTKYNAQNAAGLPHDYDTMHVAANEGAWNRWVPAKGRHTMGYFTRDDIPFQYALSDAFTTCDHYFSSMAGPTDPNRLYLWSGCAGPGKDGKTGPWTDNTPVTDNPVADWTTYAERLHDAGVSWRVYHNPDGDDEEYGDYDDNALSYFAQFHKFAKDDPRYVNAMTKHDLDAFAEDCQDGTLPTVSWLVAPYNYCEHPDAGPNYGAHWVNRALQAVMANPDVWRHTVFLLMYDENDGYFDHVPAPQPEPGTPEEFDDDGAPLGLGPRVPLWVISPWSRGGRVNSQVFDHTSVLMFLEQVTGVREPNISAWRRTVCGDLTSTLDFSSHDMRKPRLPGTEELKRKADKAEGLPAVPVPGAGEQQMPHQEPGSRPHCPLPYRPHADAVLDRETGKVTCNLVNDGTAGYHFAVYPNDHKPFKPTQFTVRAGRSAEYTWDTGETDGRYDFSVYGADSFLRDASGRAEEAPDVRAVVRDDDRSRITLRLGNKGRSELEFTVEPVDFTGSRRTRRVRPGDTATLDWPTQDGWYDVRVTASGEAADGFTRRYAGHLQPE